MPGTTLNITDLVRYQGAHFRVRSFKKRVEDNFPHNPMDLLPREPLAPALAELLRDIWELDLLREKYTRAEQGLPCTRRYRFQNCTQAEATHVGLYGLTYPTAALDEVTYEGPITWAPELIQSEQAAALSDFRLIRHPFSEWLWE